MSSSPVTYLTRALFLVAVPVLTLPVALSQKPSIHAVALSVCREEVAAFRRRGTELTLWVDTGDRSFAGLDASSEIDYFGCADGMGSDGVVTDAMAVDSVSGPVATGGELIGGDEEARAAWRAETERLAVEENRFRMDTRMQVDLLNVHRAIEADDTTGFTFELKSFAVVAPTCPTIGVRGTLRYRRAGGDTLRFTLQHPGFGVVSQYDSVGGSRGVPRLVLWSTGSSMQVGDAWSDGYDVFTAGYAVQGTRVDGGEYVEGPSVWLPDDHGDAPFEAEVRALPVGMVEVPFVLEVGVGL